jgi:hypothetical protein
MMMKTMDHRRQDDRGLTAFSVHVHEMQSSRCGARDESVEVDLVRGRR